MCGGASLRCGEDERRFTDVALVGRLDGSLEVECRLLCDDRGRDERCVRLGGVARRDFVEQRLDVCPVPHGVDGSENESGDESVVVVVELLQVEEDDLE